MFGVLPLTGDPPFSTLTVKNRCVPLYKCGQLGRLQQVSTQMLVPEEVSGRKTGDPSDTSYKVLASRNFLGVPGNGSVKGNVEGL